MTIIIDEANVSRLSDNWQLFRNNNHCITALVGRSWLLVTNVFDHFKGQYTPKCYLKTLKNFVKICRMMHFEHLSRVQKDGRKKHQKREGKKLTNNEM